MTTLDSCSHRAGQGGVSLKLLLQLTHGLVVRASIGQVCPVTQIDVKSLILKYKQVYICVQRMLYQVNTVVRLRDLL